MTKPIGMPATTHASAMSGCEGGWSRSPRSARMTAKPTHSATLANSDGWIEKPPGSSTHE